jgi:hypothetical protein
MSRFWVEKEAWKHPRSKILLWAYTNRKGHTKHPIEGRFDLTVKFGPMAPNHPRTTQKFLKLETFWLNGITTPFSRRFFYWCA